MLKYVCAYCGKDLRPGGQPGNGVQPISHGICRDCVDQVMVGSGVLFDEFLDTLQAPVFVVDDSARVVTANALGRETVSKDLEQIKGHLGGEVFGCSYHHLPGGCGETLHCKTCTIRNLVMKTYATGEASIREPACLDLDTIVGPRRICFLISTEKAGNAVFLRIDDAQPEECPDAE